MFSKGCLLALLALLALPPLPIVGPASAEDRVNVVNGSGSAVGLLVDGHKKNDETFTGLGPFILVGAIRQSSVSNEVITFTAGRPPEVTAATWTQGDDTIQVNLASPIEIAVTVWIVHGPFADQKMHAYEACAAASLVWKTERMGIDFSTFEVKDATGNPMAATLSVFENGDSTMPWTLLRTNIGFDPGRLNIYWVDTVGGSTSAGWSNFGAQIVMGRQTYDHLFAHEIGHALQLRHIDTEPDFDKYNVMWSTNGVRKYFTEGQLFRAHLHPASALNDIYGARPGEPLRECDHYLGDVECPEVVKRIWADGVLPAN